MDSVLGATLQPTYYNTDKKCVVKEFKGKSVRQISGIRFLTNAQVNIVSVAISMLFGAYIGPLIVSH